MKHWLLGAMILLAATPAVAETPPDPWEAIKHPELAADYDLHLRVTQLFAAERGRDSASHLLIESAREALVARGASMSADVRLRFDLGHVDETLHLYEEGARVLESALVMAPDHAMAEEALWELAICYAHADAEKEIAAYDRYLELATLPNSRATAYSNRAEAEMRLGDLSLAIEDARYASQLGADSEITALANFDLAVALDRYGDPHGALRAVEWAMADPMARRKVSHDDEGVFFVPDYDKHWYRALARTHLAMKETSEEQALDWHFVFLEWSAYVNEALPGDRWIKLAITRRDAAEKEVRRLETELAKVRDRMPKTRRRTATPDGSTSF